MKYPWTKKPDPDTMRKTLPLTLLPRHYTEPSVFTAGGLLREARRQKSLPAGMVPEVCLLDPDGDIVRYLIAQNRAARSTVRACYHTDLYTFESAGVLFGVVGCAVGAPFAVLVAEELFSSGCQFLISKASAGQITATRRLPFLSLSTKRSGTKERAVTICHPRTMPRLMLRCSNFLREPLHCGRLIWRSVQHGPPMLHSGRPLQRSRDAVN